MSPVFFRSQSLDFGDSILDKGTPSIFSFNPSYYCRRITPKIDFLMWDLMGNRRDKMIMAANNSNLTIVVFFFTVGKTLDLPHNNYTLTHSLVSTRRKATAA
ncbi:hypothetical protein NPIL_81231 [Nephila pilipes]|uniref:Uncharacterized protein n=1 Tax=Nephila pilipes TaxID=299642 RepID=A0A8X6NP07_NEPPI|nr:hypothetical protein NPIL_81231 [Nephila pilipes]